MESQRVRRPEGPQDWEAQRAVITDLYITQGLELEDLMKTMEEIHFFKATKKQYKTYFTKWKLRKNVRPSEYSAMIKKRRQREEEGKDSAFRLRGALVNDSKIVRYEKKTKTGDEHEIAEAGTPKDLSCFTPSPVASSPNAPSPVLPQFQSPNLLRTSIVSPSEQTLLVPSPLILFSEAPGHVLGWIFSEFIEPLIDSVASRNCEFLEWNVCAQDLETVNNIIKALNSQPMERFESDLLHYPILHSFLTRRVRCLNECARKQRTFSRARRFALYSFVLFEMAFRIGHLSGSVSRLKPGSADSASEKFLRSLRINHITTSSDVRGGANGFGISVTALGSPIVIILPGLTTKDLEQKHNSPVRRSKSCESIRSIDSFLSDPVVDWKELLYGYNREAASKEREF